MKTAIAIASVLVLASCNTPKHVHTGDVPTCQTSDMKMFSEGKIHGIPVRYVNQEINRYFGVEFMDYVKQCHMGLKATRRNYTGVRDELLQCGFNHANTHSAEFESVVRERFLHPNGGYVLLYKLSQNNSEYICPFEIGLHRE